MRVRWTRPARRDLEDIMDFVARDSPSAAARLVDRILDSVATLAAHPEIGRPGRVAETRELVIVGPPYIVPYFLKRDIEVLAVFHGARRWPETFR